MKQDDDLDLGTTNTAAASTGVSSQVIIDKAAATDDDDFRGPGAHGPLLRTARRGLQSLRGAATIGCPICALF